MHPGQCMFRSSLPPHCKRQGHRSLHVCTCTSRKIISPNINKSLFFSNICSVLHAFNKSVNHKHIHVGTGTCICLKIQEYNAFFVVDEGNTKPLQKRSYLQESKPIVNCYFHYTCNHLLNSTPLIPSNFIVRNNFVP